MLQDVDRQVMEVGREEVAPREVMHKGVQMGDMMPGGVGS